MAFKAKDRQRIIDNYLAESGRNIFLPSEFVDWLQDQPDHEMHAAFFSKSDADAAREYRIGLARRMASGLRIVATASETKANIVSITTREFPAYVSPVASRKTGGGYQPLSIDDEAQLAEIRRQGAASLRGWLARYRGVFEHAGIDVSAIEEVAASQDASAAQFA